MDTTDTAQNSESSMGEAFRAHARQELGSACYTLEYIASARAKVFSVHSPVLWDCHSKLKEIIEKIDANQLTNMAEELGELLKPISEKLRALSTQELYDTPKVEGVVKIRVEQIQGYIQSALTHPEHA